MMRSADLWRRRPGYLLAVVTFGVLLAVAAVGWVNGLTIMTAYSGGDRPPPGGMDFVHTVGGGLTFAIVGFAVWWRRPRNLTGPLMIVVGASLLVWIYEWVPVPPLVTLAQMTWAAPPVLIGAVLLLCPAGRVTSRLEIAWFVGAGVLLLVGVLHALVTPIGKWDCPDCHSWITLTYDEDLSNDVWLVQMHLLGVLGIALVGLLARRWVHASRPMRRVMTPLWVSGFAFATIVLATVVLDASSAVAFLFSSLPNVIGALRLQFPPAVWIVMPWLATVAVFLIPLALFWGQLRSRWGQVAVSVLAAQLRRADRRSSLVDLLRQALGDPSAELALWSRPAQAYVTPEGLPVAISDARDDRAATRLDGDDGPLAAIIHDPVLSDQRQLIDGVSAVAQLAIENERLHAEVKAQLEEVRASRQRIVGAADEERRRVERNIHDGAQQRLVSLSLALAMAQAKATEASPEMAATLAQAEAELKQAISELRELARGIHPAILTEAGLGAALESLVEHVPTPVKLVTNLNGVRLSPVIEATAYFVAAEALTNATKHARAAGVTLAAHLADGSLHLSVHDDGIGGADPARGTGLRGLADRVAAVGGSLEIDGAPGSGTSVVAVIPCTG